VKAVEQILARASGQASVRPGEIVVANVDRLIMHDLSAYLTAKVFEEQVGGTIRYPDRVLIVFDHNFSPATLTNAEVLKYDRQWAARHGVQVADCGSGNIHNVVARRAGIKPGMVVVGSDSHTPVHGAVGAFATGLGNNSHAGTVLPFGKAWFRVPDTALVRLEGANAPGVSARDVALWLVGAIGEGGARYLALEFGGEYVESLPFWDRWMFPLITVDVGAKSGFVRPDDVTRRHLEHQGIPWTEDPLSEPLPLGEYDTIWQWDVSDLGPQVACPPSLGNVKPIEAVAGTPVQTAELGGHGGGRIEDIRVLAEVLSRHPKHPDVRVQVVPSSREAFHDALAEGLVETLHAAGATWFPPSTGSNQAVNMGAMAAGEAMVSTHARNFPGRNGSPEASMYLASALTVAASAVQGCLADPRELDVPGALTAAGRTA
jgi:3-isopropylmalate/(R)-2-methylmalate dehydratase large subunit